MTPAMYVAEFKDPEVTAERAKQFYSDMVAQTNAWLDEFRTNGIELISMFCFA